MADKILEGDDVLLIKKTNVVRKYKEDAAEGFKDKSYRCYAFGENAFVVHEDDDFHADFTAGNVQKVLVTVDKDGWSLANYIPFARAIGQRKNQVMLDSITVANYKPEKVSDKMLEGIK